MIQMHHAVSLREIPIWWCFFPPTQTPGNRFWGRGFYVNLMVGPVGKWVKLASPSRTGWNPWSATRKCFGNNGNFLYQHITTHGHWENTKVAEAMQIPGEWQQMNEIKEFELQVGNFCLSSSYPPIDTSKDTVFHRCLINYTFSTCSFPPCYTPIKKGSWSHPFWSSVELDGCSPADA